MDLMKVCTLTVVYGYVCGEEQRDYDTNSCLSLKNIKVNEFTLTWVWQHYFSATAEFITNIAFSGCFVIEQVLAEKYVYFLYAV